MSDKLLLVEGDFDRYVIGELIRQSLVHIDKIDIEPFRTKDKSGIKPDGEGIYALLKSLPTTIKATRPDRILGIVVDADLSQKGRWQRIRQILTDAGYEDLPDTFPEGAFQIVAWMDSAHNALYVNVLQLSFGLFMAVDSTYKPSFNPFSSC